MGVGGGKGCVKVREREKEKNRRDGKIDVPGRPKINVPMAVKIGNSVNL